MGVPKDVPYTPCKRMPFRESNCFAARIFDLRALLQTRTMHPLFMLPAETLRDRRHLYPVF